MQSPQRIDLAAFIREVLDGVIGDDPRPTTMDEAIACVERALEARARRRLNHSERTRVGIETGWTWNQRTLGPWHTSDGRYFASDADRRAHQRSLDERAEREAVRQRARAAGELGAA